MVPMPMSAGRVRNLRFGGGEHAPEAAPVAREIAAALTGFTLHASRSWSPSRRVPVGTADEVERMILDARPGADVGFQTLNAIQYFHRSLGHVSG
jgi:hypothetical protein